MIEVFVSRLGLDSASSSYVVVLQEKDGARLLPIWIGQPEAESIVLHMHNVKRARPLTHDLVRSLIIGLKARLQRVQITKVENRTYYGEIHLQQDDNIVEIDARPSDCIAIALRLGAPIYAAEQLLVDPGEEEDVAEEEDEAPDFTSSSEDVSEAERERERERDEELSDAERLKRYLETLRPEDFGKFNP